MSYIKEDSGHANKFVHDREKKKSTKFHIIHRAMIRWISKHNNYGVFRLPCCCVDV
jgi:hypothetical protein